MNFIAGFLKMNLHACFLTFCLFPHSCEKAEQNYILDLDNYRCWRNMAPVFPEEYESYDLTDEDIKKCEVFIRESINAMNDSEEMRYKYPYEKYGKQYIAAVAPNGHAMVYVNCFCDPKNFEDKSCCLVQVNDGGTCYFYLLIDLTDNRVVEGYSNGYALVQNFRISNATGFGS